MAGVTNVYRPTGLSFKSYGWQASPKYNTADVPTRWAAGASQIDRTVLEQQLAYEWLDSSSVRNFGPVAGGMVSTNPPFTSQAAGRLFPGLVTSTGQAPRILRGFIRRSTFDLSDPVGMARLYFMFNPETITRDYVSYLDQGALDPFNTVFQSGNLVPPPSFMDFSFSIFFDRQDEAQAENHPGVFVDYQYFDLVVRNVVPAVDPNNTNNTLPDNGIMMVNPRDITVVFSPQITVQGRPLNARVHFMKFTHRMVPIRMQIDLTMRVTYIGPPKRSRPKRRSRGTRTRRSSTTSLPTTSGSGKRPSTSVVSAASWSGPSVLAPTPRVLSARRTISRPHRARRSTRKRWTTPSPR
jgi:hypothetical protein